MRCKIRNLIKLRKQSDTMKIICILAIAGISFLAGFIYHLAGIYSYVNSPVEYVLSGDRTVSEKHINELVQIESGIVVTRQKNISVTIMYKGVKTPLECLVISKEYAENILGINTLDGTKRFYMDDETFLEWKQELEESGETGEGIRVENGVQKNGGMEFDIKYISDEGDASGQKDDSGVSPSDGGSTTAEASPEYKRGKISVIKRENMKEKIVFTIGEANDLQKNVNSLRVRFKKHDLDGVHVEKIEKLGYSFENEDMVLTDEYELKLKLLYMKYNLLCFAICLLSVWVMAHQMPKKL